MNENSQTAPGFIEERWFPPTRESVGEVRRCIDDALSNTPPDTKDITLLLAGELATNAVEHAKTSYALHLLAVAQVVRVDITDHGGGHPCVQDSDQTRAGGFGLRMVDRVATSWGVRNESDDTTVWFEIEVPDQPEAGDPFPASPERQTQASDE